MKEQFTPGPWNVAGFDSRINEERYFGIGTPYGQMIVESFGECDSDRKANAALIAAAPELYKELEKHCALCVMRHPEMENCKLCETRKVLNKARGEK